LEAAALVKQVPMVVAQMEITLYFLQYLPQQAAQAVEVILNHLTLVVLAVVVVLRHQQTEQVETLVLIHQLKVMQAATQQAHLLTAAVAAVVLHQ
jgi:hypothetical protein